ncbi:MAG TPA: hypothetical protein VHV27_05540 [Phenylobacterium sp.]|nr:hypothetical protein [Phenylobacterium sp.]
MTVRQNKRFLLIGGWILGIAVAVEIVLILRSGGRLHELVQLSPQVLMIGIIVGGWRRLSHLEAEHGPDYVQPAYPHRKTVVIVLGVLGFVLAAIAVFLVARLR